MKPDDRERRSRDARPQPPWREPDRARPPDPPAARSSDAIPILIGTRDETFAGALRAALPGAAWRVAAAGSPRAFRAALRRGPLPSFAAIDADAFGADTEALCREIRRAEAAAGAEPAVVEAWMSRMAPDDVRGALAAGADDCRAPVSAGALALLLAARTAGDAAADAGNDEVRIDAEGGRATLGGRPLPLTATCFAALCVLAGRRGAAVSRKTLLRELHGAEAGSVLPRSVDSLVSELRARLGPAGWRVATAWGLGYRWIDGPRPEGIVRAGRRRLPLRRAGAALCALLIAALAAAALRRGASEDAPAPAPPVAAAPAPRPVDPVVQRLLGRFREAAAGTEGVDVAGPPSVGPLEPPVPHWLGGLPAAAAPGG